MSTLSFTEENYLKAIYSIQQRNENAEVSVNDIAEHMNTRPATVTDMLRKLSEKKLIHYEKYKKTQLSKEGVRCALQVIRKHRLWEVFLNKKLHFNWDEVHDIAEQLEHIQSEKLVERLDKYLGYPQFDPHGDPIPNEKGEITIPSNTTLDAARTNTYWRIVGVKDTTPVFLQYLESVGLSIGSILLVKEILPYDNSVTIELQAEKLLAISEKVAANLLVVPETIS